LQTEFDKQAAASYNDNWSKIAAMKDALHLCMRFVLEEMPEDARILCVGVGTGAELLYLADAFPRWTFTALEPSAEMLNICRERANEHGIDHRCEFHEGTIDSLPEGKAFDVVTAVLVSHFLGDYSARKGFFGALSARLRSGGILINADLSADIASEEFASIFEVWQAMLSFTGMPMAEVEKYSSKFRGGDVALPSADIQEILTASGLRLPVLFCQTLLIHAWYSKR
jgi:tRNA (cmo5U34)-methyltransferase